MPLDDISYLLNLLARPCLDAVLIDPSAHPISVFNTGVSGVAGVGPCGFGMEVVLEPALPNIRGCSATVLSNGSALLTCLDGGKIGHGPSYTGSSLLAGPRLGPKEYIVRWSWAK